MDLRSLYTKKVGYQAAKDIDSALADLYSSLTSTDVGNYGTDIGDSAIVSCQQRLNEVDAPQDDRYFVIKPSQQAAIQKLDKFTSASYIGQFSQSSPIVRGPNNRYLWGDIYGDPVYVTNQVATTAGTPTQTHNLYFHKEAFVLALQQTPTVRHSFWHKDLSDLVTIDWIYGTNTLRSTFGCELRS